MPFGAHMSISGGIANAFARGAQVQCDTMQIFTKSERQWQAKSLTADDLAAYHAEQERTGIRPVVVHDSYLINLASPKDDLWERSIAAFAEELERCHALRIPYLVTHPGAHTGSGEEAGLVREAEAINRLLDAGVGGEVMILLETTAGHLLLDTTCAMGVYAKVNPPIRPREHVEYLWAHVLDGTLEWVITDHANSPKAQKVDANDPENIWKAHAGFGGTEYL